MKKLSMLAATVALAIPAPIILPAPAMATNYNGNSGFCRDAAAEYGFSSVGECVSLYTTQANSNGNGWAAQICSYADEQEPDVFAYFYASYTDCVQDGASAFVSSGGPF